MNNSTQYGIISTVKQAKPADRSELLQNLDSDAIDVACEATATKQGYRTCDRAYDSALGKRSLGKYTRHKCEQVDAQIDSKLNLINDTILRNTNGVKSILLAGGFGKGEGSVEIKKDGKIECLRDFDIVVIVDKIPNEKTQKRLHDQIHKLLSLPSSESKSFRFSDFTVCIYFRRKKDLIYPDIWFYDLKTSIVLYGEDIRNLIPWSKKDIPLSSGLRVLFEKVCGLLGLFSYSFLETEKLPENQEKVLIFECYKTFIEICTALSILANEYEPQYATRAKNLSEFYSDRFPEFAEILPDLPKRVEACTNFKLKPSFPEIHEQPTQLWFSARDSLGTALSLYLKRYVGMTLSDWADLSGKTKILARHYYKSFLGPFLRAKLRFSNAVTIDIASLFFQTLMNVEYSYVVSRDAGQLYLHPLRRFYISPSLKFFQAGIMILFSLNMDGTINEKLLKKAAEELRQCVPVEISKFDVGSWDTLRKTFLKAYSLCSGHHFVK